MTENILTLTLIMLFSGHAFAGIFSNQPKDTLDHKELDLNGITKTAYYADVCGDVVVYSGGPACDFTWDIKHKNITTGQVGAFYGVKGGTVDNQARIDGHIVVWCGGPAWKSPWTHEPSNFSVFARNMTTGSQKTLREYTMSESYSHPAVSGTKVVWLEHRGLDSDPKGSRKGKNWWNTPFNVCGADITDIENPVYFTIAENAGTRDPYPCLSYWKSFDTVIDISGDTVVWEANGDIFGADISDLSKITVFTICDDPDGQYNPAISDDTAVWTDQRNDGGDIYGATILDMKDVRSFPIIRKAGVQRQPAIDGDMIVYVSSWSNLKNGPGDIKMCRITDFPDSEIVALKEKFTGQRPAINGGTVLWQDHNKQKGIAGGISIDRPTSKEKSVNIADCRME